MKPTLVARAAVAAVSIILCGAAAGATLEAEAAIRDLLRKQAEAWNRGDIDGFMNGYARRDDLTFVSGDQVRHGWKTVRQRYKARYPDRTAMGQLTFSDVHVRMLSTDAAIAYGQFSLKREQDRPHGRFTLILQRLPEGWRIVHDHTSSAESKH